MLSRYLLAVASVSITFSGAYALNDWSKPCFDGECAYDLPASSGGSGIFKMFGSPKAITDITPAAGWVILDCDPNLAEQEVRLVCETDHAESGCQHVFDHHGPMDKIVRLPESCGKGPFARIASMKVAEDQSLPAHAQGRVRRRDGAAPEVHVMSLDGNFAAIDHAKVGEVKFGFVGATVPGLDLNEAFVDWFWDDIAKWVSGAANTVASAVKGAVAWVGDRFKDIGDMIKNKTSFEIGPKVEAPNIPLNADVKLTELVPPVFCNGAFHSRTDVSVHSEGSISVKAGIVIAGSVVPPSISKFAAFGGVNGSVDAKVHVDLALQGGFSYEKKLLNDVGLPGLSIPLLITIGPYVSLAAKAQGHLELDITADVHLSYIFDDLELWYPKEHANLHKEKGIKSQKSDLSLQASAHVNAKGFVQGTLSPQIHFGISAIGGSVSASLYVGADAWVRASVQAQADASANIGGKTASPAKKGASPAKGAPPAKGHKGKRDTDVIAYVPPYAHHMRDLAAASIGFSGCLWLDVGLHLKGGAEGGIFSWKASGEITIWESPAWQLLEKCWTVGNAATKPKGFTKPVYTLKQVSDLAAGKQACSTQPEISLPVKDTVPAKTLKP